MKIKKLLVSLIAAAAVACTIGVTASAEADTWDSTVDTTWYTEAEAGTTEFEIETAEELAGLATLVNEGDSFSGKTITLTESLDLAGYNWTPIGTKANPFSGIFDGGKDDGIKISNLYIENTNPEVDKNYGLFGTIYCATLQNVYLDNVDITVTGKTGHGYYTGGLVGFANSYPEVKDSTKLLNSTVTGELLVSGRGCGGIVGYAFATTKLDGLTFGDATAAKSSLSIDDVNRDLAYGGIVGYTYYVSAFNNLHMVNAEINGSTLTAGLIGWYNNDGASCNITNCSVIDSEINGANGTGGIVGLYNSPVSISSTTVENTEINGVEQKSGVFVGFYDIGRIDPNEVIVDEDCESVNNTGSASATTGIAYAAEVNGTYYTTIADAIKAAVDGDTVTIAAGTHKGGFSVGGKNIILEGTLGANGEILTIIDGDNGNSSSYYRYAISMGTGTIKNLKIVNAWKGIFTESKSGSLTIDNVEMVGIGYGIHIAGAKNAESVVTIKNSNIDITWANSFASGDYKIVVENNVFTSNDPYYPDYGTVAVNTFVPNTTIKDNNFGENIKIYIDAAAVPDTSNIVIGTNYYADGAENVFPDDEEGVTVPIYTEYTTPEMNEKVYTSDLKATLNGEYYPSIQAAVDAAEKNDVIVVSAGTHTEKLKINKSVVLTGNPNYGADAALAAEGDIVKPVINISDVTNGGVQYETANITFDNLVFNVLADATGETWNVSALGYYYENTADRNGLTVTNCDFINNSKIGMSAIAANLATYTITGNTFKNFDNMVHSFVDHGALGEVVISGNTYENVENIANVYWGAANEAATLTITNNTATDDSTAKIIVDDFGKTKATPVTAIPTAIISGNDAELSFHNYSADNDLTTDEPMTNYYRTYEIAKALDGKLPNGVVYVVYYTNDAGKLVNYETPKKYIVAENMIKTEAESVALVFTPNTTYDAEALENSVWDIKLVANAGGILNRLNSVDFTFVLTTDEDADDMSYEIIATNGEIVINNVNNDANRYEFHYDGKTGTITDTAMEITIGTVKFTGYGPFTFAVDTTDVAENTNQVHTTTFVDNIVDSFIVGGVVDADGNVTNELKVDSAIDSEIIVPTQALTIKLDFPNSVSDNAVAYQQMKVTVSGGDLEQALVIDLGTDYDVSDLTVYDNKKDIAVEISDLYTIEITNLLEINTSYNVEVSGAGYRTAKYTVTMTEDKTLNFWNNVKDNAVEVEEKKSSSAKNVTFLAGDIVKDGTINIYDLSAVVSYFGEIKLVEENKTTYAKYDLNRDGKIDSKDVAYVLVSWGN